MAIVEDPLNIVITGVGGQGNILASQLTATAAIQQGLFASVGETYGASQRGGSVTSQLRLSTQFQYGPLIPAGQAHIVVGFEPMETLRVLVAAGNDNTSVILNPRPNYPLGVLSGAHRYPPLEEILQQIDALIADPGGNGGTRSGAVVIRATDLAVELGTAVSQNVVMVGALAASELLPVPITAFESAIDELFDDQSKRDLNKKAFRAGVRAFREAQPQ